MSLLVWCFCLWSADALIARTRTAVDDSIARVAQHEGLRNTERRIGRLLLEAETEICTLNKDSIRLIAGNELGEILQRGTPFMPLRQGFTGQWDGVDICGILPSSQVVTHNGIPVTTVTSGSYSPLMMSPGYIERIEILTGTDAIGSLPSAALAGFNLQKRSYNSARPFTAMSYFQGAGDLVGGGVTYAQNLSTTNSVAAQVRRSGARGVYQKTDYDAWNVHLQDRVRLDSSNVLLGTYDLYTSDMDPWGGLTQDPFPGADLIETISPKNQYAREVTRRHDMALQHSYSSGNAHGMDVVSSLYGNSNALKRSDTVWRSWYSGLTSSVHWAKRSLRLGGGAKIEYQSNDIIYRDRDVSSLNMSSWVKATYELTDHLQFASSLRYDYGTRRDLGYGVAITYRDSAVTYKADMSQVDNMIERSRAQLIYGLARYSVAGVPIQAIAYHYNGNQTSTGVLLSAAHRASTWDVSGQIRVMTRKDSTVSGTTYFVSAQLAYIYSTTSSTIWFGAEGGLLGSNALPQFDVYERSYTSLPLVAGSNQNTGLSLFAKVIVGTASLRASFDNILGARWYTVAFMPDVPRQFRLSLDWTFVD